MEDADRWVPAYPMWTIVTVSDYVREGLPGGAFLRRVEGRAEMSITLFFTHGAAVAYILSDPTAAMGRKAHDLQDYESLTAFLKGFNRNVVRYVTLNPGPPCGDAIDSGTMGIGTLLRALG